MTSRPQFPRSNVTGSRPATLLPGSPAFNWQDKAIWVGDASGNAVRFTRKVEDWDQTKSYYADDIVIRQGDLWRATRAVISAGSPFAAADWQRLSDATRANVSEPYSSDIYSGGVIAQVSASQISVGAGAGVVVNNTNPAAVAAVAVAWSAFTITLVDQGEPWSVVGINAAGIASQVPYQAYAPNWRRDNVELAFVLWGSGGIQLVIDGSVRAGGTAETFRDFYTANGGAYRAAGVALGAGAVALSLALTSGSVFALGQNWRAAPNSPNILNIAAIPQVNFRYTTGRAILAPARTTVAPDLYNPGGGATVAPVALGASTIQYVYGTPDMATILIQYGQQVYATDSAALSNLAADYTASVKFLYADPIILLGAVVVESGQPTLASATFVNAAPFGEPFGNGVSLDGTNFYLLDGSRALTGGMDAAGNKITATTIDGADSDILVGRSGITGVVPATATAAEAGEIFVNYTDRKVYVRNSTGVMAPVADRIAVFSTGLKYAVGDLVIEANALYINVVPVTAPGAFTPGSWQVISSGAAALAGAVITAPLTSGRNTVSTISRPLVEGMVVVGDAGQTADLLVVEGSAATDTGRWAIDNLGFPNKRAGAASWRQVAVGHPFTARGQPAALTGAVWGLASATAPTGKALAVVDEIIDVNTVVLRAAGLSTQLQTAAFAGGIITPGALYYVSETVPGQLTTTEPVAARIDPVLVATSATTGLLQLGADTSQDAPVTISATPPANPRSGGLWYSSVAPIGLFIWFVDIDSSQWVEVAGSGGGGGGSSGPAAAWIGADPPPNPTEGILWWDNSNPIAPQFFIFDQNGIWRLVIPEAGLPIGSIVMFNGSLGDVATNWSLCDGTNGTPNLSDKFIVGASPTKPINTTGGQSAITQVPAHGHGAGTLAVGAAGGHGHGVNDPTHNHTLQDRNDNTGTGLDVPTPAATSSTSFSNSTAMRAVAAATGISIQAVGDHTHSFTGTVANAGVASVDITPPYYALAYIRRMF